MIIALIDLGEGGDFLHEAKEASEKATFSLAKPLARAFRSFVGTVALSGLQDCYFENQGLKVLSTPAHANHAHSQEHHRARLFAPPSPGPEILVVPVRRDFRRLDYFPAAGAAGSTRRAALLVMAEADLPPSEEGCRGFFRLLRRKMAFSEIAGLESVRFRKRRLRSVG